MSRFDRFNTMEAAVALPEFPQFRELGAEVQLRIFQEAAIVAAQELPDVYGFEYDVFKGDDTISYAPSAISSKPRTLFGRFRRHIYALMQTGHCAPQDASNGGDALGSDNSVAFFKPTVGLDHLTKNIRALMQTCRSARKAAINVTGSFLETTYADERRDTTKQQLRYATMPIDYERSALCVNLGIPSRILPVIAGTASLPRLCTRGFEFASHVKNLTLIAQPYFMSSRVLREDVNKIVARFPSITTCRLINCDFWVKSEDFYKDASAYERAMRDLQSCDRKTLEFHSTNCGSDGVSAIEHATDELDKLQSNNIGWAEWSSAKILLEQITEGKASRTKTVRASCEYLLVNLRRPRCT